MPSNVMKWLRQTGAILTNTHVVLKSGKHSNGYVNKDAVFTNPAVLSDLCQIIAGHFQNDFADVVIGPVVGGAIMSNRTAHHLSILTNHGKMAAFADKDGDGFVIKRGYEKLIAGRNVLVVEDVVTTGGSAKKVIAAARALGANVVGLGVLCNRGGLSAEDFDVPHLFALTGMEDVQFDTWVASECPLCQAHVAINTAVGHGAEFLAQRAATT